LNDVKQNKLLDTIKAKKLNECLSKIPQRTLKNANDKIIGEGDNVKGAIRRMLIAY
jgi:hypothetical protein